MGTPNSNIAADYFEKGDIVKIVSGSKWSTGASIPSWVIKKEWIVRDASKSDSKVLIDKSTDGANSINSFISYSSLILVKAIDPKEDATEGKLKYSTENPPLVCMQTQSTCYKGTSEMTVLGVLWHSTGANNKTIKRYVQPSDNDPRKAELIKIIGENKYKNDWNHINHKAGLNAWVGALADGSVSSVQTMPWNWKPWGCGTGKKGSCNNGWIQFEICEDNLKDASYFNKVYEEACQLTAYLCRLFNLNPSGKVSYNGINVPVILCHADSYDLGLGSNHSDTDHWFSKFGKSMDTVRKDVAQLLDADAQSSTQVSGYKKGVATKLSANFKSTEFDCHGSGCCNRTLIDKKLVEYLQKIRDHFGKPVNISSGYRCEKHNKSVGGATSSRHMKGQAADIYIDGVAPVEIARYAESINILGIGLYETDKDGHFVHIDTRDTKSFWYGQAQEIRDTFVCNHARVEVKNKKSATCTAAGYTGDTVCAVCGAVLEKGTSITVLPHKYTVVGKVNPTTTTAGYTGDKVCSSCEHRIAGSVIDKIDSVTVKLGQDMTVDVPTKKLEDFVTWFFKFIES